MNWQGEIPRATPLTAFLVGLFTGVAIQVGLRQDIDAFPDHFIISLLLISSVVLWFVFVVRGSDYEFRWWCGFRDLKVQALVSGICWFIGTVLTILISKSH